MYKATNKCLNFVVIFFFLGFGTSVFAEQEEFLKLKLLESQGALISISVSKLPGGKEIYSYNENKHLTPASVSKVILAAAALDKWGADYTFKTRIYSTVPKTGKVIKGDIVFQGGGDPYLTNEKLWFLCTDVARAGIKEITGNLILNTSLFDMSEVDGNRQIGQKYSSHAYDSQLSAVAVNFGVMAAVVSPGGKSGEFAPVNIEPYAMPFLQIKSKVTTSGVNTSPQISVKRETNAEKKFDIVHVSGSIPLNSFPVRVYRSVSNAEEYAGNTVKSFLEAAGVNVAGNIIIQAKPMQSNLIPLVEVESFPLEWQLRGLFKVSNNFIGDMLTLQYDLEDKKFGARLMSGAKKLKNFVVQTMSAQGMKINSPLNELVIESGSGLTPANKMSSAEINNVLNYMYVSKEFPAFYAALPSPGNEGTLKRRFENMDVSLKKVVKIRAKTGTLSEPIDAVGLAGYVQKQGNFYAFSVIVNGTKKHPNLGLERMRDAIDEDVVNFFKNSFE